MTELDDLKDDVLHLGGLLTAHQQLLEALLPQAALTMANVDDLMARYRIEVADRGVRGMPGADAHWAGYQLGMHGIRARLPRGCPGE